MAVALVRVVLCAVGVVLYLTQRDSRALGRQVGDPTTPDRVDIEVTAPESCCHHDVPDDEQFEHHRKGWELYLERLAARVGGGDPGPDPNA